MVAVYINSYYHHDVVAKFKYIAIPHYLPFISLDLLYPLQVSYCIHSSYTAVLRKVVLTKRVAYATMSKGIMTNGSSRLRD